MMRTVTRMTILLAATILLTGCTETDDKDKDTAKPTAKDEKKPAANLVRGKVTLDGKPVAGQVIFLDADGKELNYAPLTADGRYFLDDPPVGKYKIVIRPLTKRPEKPKLPEIPLQPKQGVEAPAKYGKTETSGLTYEVKAGVQEFNIDLKK